MAGGIHRLDRRAAVARLLQNRTDLLVVSGLGSATYDVAAAGDHERNAYLWGAMGGTVAMGLGLALAQPNLPVAVITGDGDLLMSLGSLATVAVQAPLNLSIVVLDNALFGETGKQSTHTAGPTDLATIARGCGIADARDITHMEEVAELALRVHRIGDGPCFARICIDDRDQPRVLPTRDGARIAARIRAALGLAPL